MVGGFVWRVCLELQGTAMDVLCVRGTGTVECGCSDSYLGKERRATLPCTDMGDSVASSLILVLQAETAHKHIAISVTNKVRVTRQNHATNSV